MTGAEAWLYPRFRSDHEAAAGTTHSASTQNLNQFDLENQIAVRLNFAADGTVAIGKSGGNVQHPFVARFHEPKRFCPAGNYFTDTKCRGHAAVDGAVEDRAISECAAVVNHDRVEIGGRASARGSGGEHLVLQTAGSGHSA